LVDCISIFSGAGGLDAGARQAGARIVAAIEIDHDSTETLRQNSFGPAHNILETDIREVDFTQWRQASPNILIGGPPCQPFSKNGYWVRNDNRLIADDPRNMLGQFLRAVSEMHPAGFLFENVDSILHPTNKPSLDSFLAVAEELGYTCTLFRAYALDFGIPQRRRRVFVFGIRGKHSQLPDPRPTHANPVDPKCSIPDDHIDPRRWALFAARWVLGDSRKEKRHARTTA
jgi:DNA (cytosine-5)-methyltransferase 1